ncbi:toxin-antitoxin system HicB family antitoxin [Actinomadura gamaensis]|uniref:Toxin-antitoxin system HicB family antitoxin n=1 Tax=Actinomadura gamaensis TaxID=1763541 RepID=A0ABV9TTJ8_9ACTN
MELGAYVENLRRELVLAAEAGGDEGRVLAERLSGALEAAARLTLLEALSAAADEITRDLAPGSVDVRLRGGEPAFVVTPPDAPGSGGGASLAQVAPMEDGGTARMTLRLPEQLKARVEDAAGRQGISVNAWLVRAVAGAAEPGPGQVALRTQSGRDHTGWAR